MKPESNNPGQNPNKFDEQELARLSKLADDAGFLNAPLLNEQVEAKEHPDQFEVGTAIDGYVLVDLIAAGGSANVYRATQTKVANREVAIKIYLRTRGECVQNELEDEIATLARLDHPNLARILDAGTTPNGRTYVVQPLLSGVELDAFCSKKDVDFVARAAIIRQVAAAIHELHTLGYVHCDLKPSNILVDSNGSPTVTDFDSARLLGTVADLVHGTVGFLAPEQITDRKLSIDERTDVYALGATLYHILCRQSIFSQGSTSEKLVATVFDDVVPPHDLDSRIPTQLSGICMRCLAKSPDDRYASAADLVFALDDFITSDQQEKKPSKLRFAVPAVIACILLGSALGYLVTRSNDPIDVPEGQAVAETSLAATRQLRETLREIGPGEKLAGKPREEGLSAVARQFAVLMKQQPGRQGVAHEYAVAEWCLGAYLRDLGKFAEARTAMSRAINAYERVLESGYRQHDIKFDLFHAHHGMSIVLENLGARAEALENSDRATELIAELYEAEGSNHVFADCYAAQLISSTCAREKEMPLAWSRERYERALSVAEALRQDQSSKIQHWRHRTDASYSLGRVHINQGDLKQALRYYDQAIKYADEMVAVAPEEWGYRCDRITALHAACLPNYKNGFEAKAKELFVRADNDIAWLVEHRPDSVLIQTFRNERRQIIDSF